MTARSRSRWNHNTHYHPLVLAAAPARCERALDVGCGEGVLAHPFEPASFDLVAAVATLHHMDAAAGLACLCEFVRPGGALVVIGLARSSSPADLAFDVAGVAAHWLVRTWRGYWEHDAPKVWPPPHSYTEMRRIAERALPGARYRRHLYFRYSLAWRRER